MLVSSNIIISVQSGAYPYVFVAEFTGGLSLICSTQIKVANLYLIISFGIMKLLVRKFDSKTILVGIELGYTNLELSLS